MTKQEFIQKLAKRTDLSSKQARQIVDSMLDLIVEQTSKGNKVTLTGFGTFEARKQKATQRINPQTAAKMQVPSKNVPKFRPGSNFKQALSESKRKTLRSGRQRQSRELSRDERERRVQKAINSFVEKYDADLRALADG